VTQRIEKKIIKVLGHTSLAAYYDITSGYSEQDSERKIQGKKNTNLSQILERIHYRSNHVSVCLNLHITQYEEKKNQHNKVHNII
jgi:hypothetical protein